MSGFNEAEQELEKVEETLAMADRAIQIARQEQERIAADLDGGSEGLVPDQGPDGPAGTTL